MKTEYLSILLHLLSTMFYSLGHTSLAFHLLNLFLGFSFILFYYILDYFPNYHLVFLYYNFFKLQDEKLIHTCFSLTFLHFSLNDVVILILFLINIFSSFIFKYDFYYAMKKHKDHNSILN